VPEVFGLFFVMEELVSFLGDNREDFFGNLLHNMETLLFPFLLVLWRDVFLEKFCGIDGVVAAVRAFRFRGFDVGSKCAHTCSRMGEFETGEFDVTFGEHVSGVFCIFFDNKEIDAFIEFEAVMEERFDFFLEDKVVFIVHFLENIVRVVDCVDCMTPDTEVIFEDGSLVVNEFIYFVGVL